MSVLALLGSCLGDGPLFSGVLGARLRSRAFGDATFRALVARAFRGVEDWAFRAIGAMTIRGAEDGAFRAAEGWALRGVEG